MTASPQDQFSNLIGEIYDAGLSTQSWPGLLRRLSEILVSVDVSLFVRDLEAQKMPEALSDDLEKGKGDEGQKYHLRITVNALHEAPAAGGDVGVPGADTGDATRQPQAPIVLGCFISRDKPMGSLLGIQRHEKQNSKVPWDPELLRLLAPHLRRAFDVHKQFLSLNVQRAATRRVLDHLPIGVILVDARGRVLTMNSCAEAMVAEGDGISVDRTGVCADSGEETASLRSLIGRVANPGNGHAAPASGALSLSRPSMRRPFWAMVAPLRKRSSEDDAAPAVVALFVCDPERRHEIPAGVLQSFFGLTPAEIKLLEALVNGLSLEDASAEFQVSKNTLRTQLHQIFRKTATSRQSEVIKLALSAPVQINEESEGA